jgi:hypothetical protein
MEQKRDGPNDTIPDISFEQPPRRKLGEPNDTIPSMFPEQLRVESLREMMERNAANLKRDVNDLNLLFDIIKRKDEVFANLKSVKEAGQRIAYGGQQFIIAEMREGPEGTFLKLCTPDTDPLMCDDISFDELIPKLEFVDRPQMRKKPTDREVQKEAA